MIRNRLKLEACKMMGDKLSTVGIYVMRIRAKEKVSLVSQGQENINPFSMALNSTEKKTQGVCFIRNMLKHL